MDGNPPRLIGRRSKETLAQLAQISETLAGLERRLEALDAAVTQVREGQEEKTDGLERRLQRTERRDAERSSALAESVAGVREQAEDLGAKLSWLQDGFAGLADGNEDRLSTIERDLAKLVQAGSESDERIGAFESRLDRLIENISSSGEILRRVLGPHARFSSGPLLEAVSDADIRLVDIGARGGPKRQVLSLARFAQLFAVEADAAEAERLEERERTKSKWRAFTVVPEAIASQEGEIPFYETGTPGWSSLLEPDPEVGSEYLVPQSFTVERESTVPAITLDHAATKYGFENACFVKIDTQGSELDVLSSGRELLERSVVGIYVESNFRPFYKGQSLFADVDLLLREHGFVLVDLYRTRLRRAGFRPGLFSRRPVVWAHCLYLRDPSVLAARPDEEARPLLVRYLALCLTYFHHDLALALFQDERITGLLSSPDGESLEEAVEKHIKSDSMRRLRGLTPEQKEAMLDGNDRDLTNEGI